MAVDVHLFAALREAHGAPRVSVELLPGETAAQLLNRLVPTPDGGRDFDVLYAVGRTYVSGDHPLRDGDEVAFIPPLGGGSADPRVGLTHQALDPRPVERRVRATTRGALVTFQGTVRDSFEDKAVTRLEYEAYEPMALRELAGLCDAVADRWPGASASIVHRLGPVAVGEVAVVVCVASPHRAEAFEACAWAMTTLKKTAPIFKKELYADGSVWKGQGAG